MSHTYHDEPTGIRFHYNSDLSGDVEIGFPNNESLTTHIPGEALSRFFLHAVLDPEEMLAWLDDVRDWVTRHTNVVPGPVPPPKPFRWPPEKRCETCEGMPDDCYPDPPDSGGCEYHKPKKVERGEFKFAVGEPVFLTFSEANGETGVVTDVGYNTTGAGRYEYADVKLDKDGTQTGPLPVTCVHIRRPEDR